MNEKALKIVNSLITSDLIQTVTEKTKLDQRTVVQIAIEISGKLIRDESNISKNQLEDNIKKLVQNDELKSFLESLENKHNISKTEGSAILSELLPPIFRNFLKIDQSYFEDKEEEIKSVVVKEELKEEKQAIEEQVIVEEKRETSVDNVLENIEKKAAEDIPSIQKEKKKLFSFKKKVKEESAVNNAENDIEVENEGNYEHLSIIENVCMIVVAVVFVALLAVLGYLFVKQKINL